MRYRIDANVNVHVLNDDDILTEKEKTATAAIYELVLQNILEEGLNSTECPVKVEVDCKVVEEE